MSHVPEDDEIDISPYLYCDPDEGDDGNAPDLNVLLLLQKKLIDYEREVSSLRAQLASVKQLSAELQKQLTDGVSAENHALSSSEEPPLLTAVRTGNIELATMLLDAGADVHMLGDASIVLACQASQSRGMVSLLVSKGANVNADYGTPLLWAIARNDVELMETLLDLGADPNVLRGLPLKLATQHSLVGAANMLLARGASP